MTSYKFNQVLLSCFNKISFFLSQIAEKEEEEEEDCDPNDTGCVKGFDTGDYGTLSKYHDYCRDKLLKF